MASPAPAAKPAAPERTAYGLERRQDNTWVQVEYRIRGESVVSRAVSDNDAFSSQLAKLVTTLRRLV